MSPAIRGTRVISWESVRRRSVAYSFMTTLGSRRSIFSSQNIAMRLA